MPGLVVRVVVAPGDRVFRGQGLLAVESMKMESLVPSPADGVVEAVLVKPGQPVETGEVLVRFAG
jgi:biotin carboxyl carrier protein